MDAEEISSGYGFMQVCLSLVKCFCLDYLAKKFIIPHLKTATIFKSFVNCRSQTNPSAVDSEIGDTEESDLDSVLMEQESIFQDDMLQPLFLGAPKPAMKTLLQPVVQMLQSLYTVGITIKVPDGMEDYKSAITNMYI